MANTNFKHPKPVAKENAEGIKFHIEDRRQKLKDIQQVVITAVLSNLLEEKKRPHTYDARLHIIIEDRLLS